MEDKILICKDCGKEFTFTAGEQEFYSEKGFENDPKRCKACRDQRKNSERRFYEAVCAECGRQARVPFQPADGQSVYCSDCFSKRRETSTND